METSFPCLCFSRLVKAVANAQWDRLAPIYLLNLHLNVFKPRCLLLDLRSTDTTLEFFVLSSFLDMGGTYIYIKRIFYWPLNTIVFAIFYKTYLLYLSISRFISQ